MGAVVERRGVERQRPARAGLARDRAPEGRDAVPAVRIHDRRGDDLPVRFEQRLVDASALIGRGEAGRPDAGQRVLGVEQVPRRRADQDRVDEVTQGEVRAVQAHHPVRGAARRARRRVAVGEHDDGRRVEVGPRDL